MVGFAHTDTGLGFFTVVWLSNSVTPCTLERGLQTFVMCVPFVIFVKDLSRFGRILLLVNIDFYMYARGLMEVAAK